MAATAKVVQAAQAAQAVAQAAQQQRWRRVFRVSEVGGAAVLAEVGNLAAGALGDEEVEPAAAVHVGGAVADPLYLLVVAAAGDTGEGGAGEAGRHCSLRGPAAVALGMAVNFSTQQPPPHYRRRSREAWRRRWTAERWAVRVRLPRHRLRGVRLASGGGVARRIRGTRPIRLPLLVAPPLLASGLRAGIQCCGARVAWREVG